jgi:CheY-like chemotaxis protein
MPHSGSHLVLLVDDDVDIRDAIADVLQGAGCEVVTAEDGGEALAKLAAVARPCLISWT